MSTSSTIKGPEKSKSSKSSWKDNLLELLENPMRGESLEDSKPEKRPESSLLSLNPCKVYQWSSGEGTKLKTTRASVRKKI